MKSFLRLFICCFLMLSAFACAQNAEPEKTPEHVHSFSKADCENPSVCTECGLENEPALGHTVKIGKCARCGKIVNEEHLDVLSQHFLKVAEIGTEVPTYFMNVDGKGAEEHYSAFTSADPVIDEYNEALEKVLADCEGYDELRFLAYQVQLMMNRTPTRTGSTDYSYLVDKTDQYIDFLTQFASSVRYCTEELIALHGKEGTLIGDVEYYEEMPDMPKPDKVIHDIHLLSDGAATGEKKYTYYIDSEADLYNSNFSNYLFLLNHSGWLSVEQDNENYYVIKNGRTVAVIRLENDSDGKPSFSVAFSE